MKHFAAALILATFCSVVVAQDSRPAQAAAAPEATPEQAEQPNRWEKAIQKFEASDAEAPPPQGAILFIGSSSIRGWKLGRSFPDLTTINRGFGGSAIADSTHFAERIVFPYAPSAVVLYAGDNDIARKMTAEEVAEDFAEFVAAVRGALLETPIVFISIKPSIARLKFKDEMARANGLILEQIEADATLHYVDIFTPMLDDTGMPRAELFVSDGLHLKPEGYALWAEAVRPKLVEIGVAPELQAVEADSMGAAGKLESVPADAEPPTSRPSS